MLHKGRPVHEACAAEDGARDDGDEEHDVYLEAAAAPGAVLGTEFWL